MLQAWAPAGELIGVLHMRENAAYVGIDVSKDKLDVAVGSGGAVCRLANTSAGIEKLLRRLKTVPVAMIALEATGGYKERLADVLTDAGHAVAVVNPGRIRHLARSLGVLAKTDAIDARMIARYAEVAKPSAKARPAGAVRALGGAGWPPRPAAGHAGRRSEPPGESHRPHRQRRHPARDRWFRTAHKDPGSQDRRRYRR